MMRGNIACDFPADFDGAAILEPTTAMPWRAMAQAVAAAVIPSNPKVIIPLVYSLATLHLAAL